MYIVVSLLELYENFVSIQICGKLLLENTATQLFSIIFLHSKQISSTFKNKEMSKLFSWIKNKSLYATRSQIIVLVNFIGDVVGEIHHVVLKDLKNVTKLCCSVLDLVTTSIVWTIIIVYAAAFVSVV